VSVGRAALRRPPGAGVLRAASSGYSESVLQPYESPSARALGVLRAVRTVLVVVFCLFFLVVAYLLYLLIHG